MKAGLKVRKRIWIFSGKQGAGKTTFSDALAYRFGDHCKRMKFADVLYEMHDACLPILKQWGIRPLNLNKDGELLQVLGTEYGRKKLGENVWVDALKVRVNEWLAQHPRNVVIIDDCRFENEFDAFCARAHMIRLNAPEDIRKKRCSYWREATDHPSETGLDRYAKQGRFNCTVNTAGGAAHESLESVVKVLDGF